jgi:hypothetical protein
VADEASTILDGSVTYMLGGDVSLNSASARSPDDVLGLGQPPSTPKELRNLGARIERLRELL